MPFVCHSCAVCVNVSTRADRHNDKLWLWARRALKTCAAGRCSSTSSRAVCFVNRVWRKFVTIAGTRNRLPNTPTAQLECRNFASERANTKGTCKHANANAHVACTAGFVRFSDRLAGAWSGCSAHFSRAEACYLDKPQLKAVVIFLFFNDHKRDTRAKPQ